ncbi:modular serine protease-like [Drosophila miranda]|uniref:modular serine protease-like n=1 Tax=Drosophila miranda TaxID=7229 RepID=UPI00143F2C26|nr:modular serine protease-like [Drosophila miranda]
MFNWKPFVWLPILVLGCDAAEVCNDKEWQCEEDGKCISFDDRCNGTPDCEYGSDESFAECKAHPGYMERGKFYCATGVAMIDAVMCNNITECPDGTDELPQLCVVDVLRFKDLKVQGMCNSSEELECLPGECVHQYRTCDGRIDCSNGRDESLEVCLDPCKGCFQCANGLKVDEKHICDNKIDCLDGSDELFNVCDGEKNWVKGPDMICIEPPGGCYVFTNNTKFHSKNGTRFVYANQPAELQCQSKNHTVWNVCMNDGSWHRPTKPVFENRNPDTNGTNGCPMNWYNNETMIIYEIHEGGYSTIIEPPIHNMQVKFECRNNYYFLPYLSANDTIICQNKHWIIEDFNPRCTKLCNPSELTKLYSMSPICKHGENGRRVNCQLDKYSLTPDTRVEFVCAEGFTDLTSDKNIVICNENGVWEGLQDLCLNQIKLCEYGCHSRRHKAVTFSKSGDPTNSHHASWVVPIYTNKNDTQYKFACVGNLIGLHVVLTAAHCIMYLKPDEIRVGTTGNRSEVITITEEYYAVEQVEKYIAYEKNNHNHDLGIIILKRHIKLREDLQVVCLPYDLKSPINLNGLSLEVFSWSATGFLTSVSGAITVRKEHSGDVGINLLDDKKLCHGDSGAGVIVPCETSALCLVGVVSRSEMAVDRLTNCSGDVTAASIVAKNVQDWIKENINIYSICPTS